MFKTKSKYDERQIAVQGKAFKWGYFTLMAALMVYGVSAAVWDWVLPVVGCMLCICLSMAVYGCICIFGDAYWWADSSRTGQYATFGILGAMNIGLGIFAISDGYMVEDGVLQEAGANLALGAVFIIVFAAAFVRRRQVRREDDGE